MLAYLIRRLLYIFPVLFVVAIVTFIIMHATPGGPWDTEAGRRSADPRFQETLNRRYGLDKPLFVNAESFAAAQAAGANPLELAQAFMDAQFGNYVWNLMHGDMGPSYRMRGRDVQDVMFAPDEDRPFWTSRVGTTALIGLTALCIALLVGVPLGILAALKHNTIVDYASLFFATVGFGIPNFVLGVFFIIIFAVGLNLMSVITPAVWDPDTNLPNMSAVILPALTLAVPTAAYMARLTRSSVLEVLRRDYIRTARAKGLAERWVVVRHMLRNALIPVATVIGPALATLVTGSFVIEQLFGINGIGRLYVESIARRDYSMIMGTTLFYALMVALANAAVDVVYGLLDPRIKLGE